jgi:molecular chaperone HtpG
MDVTRTKPAAEGEDEKETETVIEEETLNSQKAIWARPKSEIKDDEYKEFYKHISHDFHDPLKTVHWQAEGATEFKALIFLPEKAPMDFFMPEMHSKGIHLYVKRVFITDNCEALIPPYLRFLRGVVDSSDLPLNVSRETLQEEKVIRVIQKNVVKKTLDTLSEMQEKEREQYAGFWQEFGRVLKEGIHLDFANREKLQDLAMFQTTKTGADEWISLAEYVERMPESQKEIYFLTGESRAALEKSPLLETFRKRDIEVVFMTDPIDEWVVQSMNTYKEKPVKSIAKGDITLEGEEEAEKEKEAKEKVAEEYKPLVTFLKDALKEQVKDIRISRRLTDSACCLVSDEADMGVHMEKILKAMHKDMPATKRILEINPEHALLKTMNNLVGDKKHHLKVTEFAELLYDQALLTAGLPVPDPVRFAQRISSAMAAEGELLNKKK